jgi:hypothetical protein
MYMGHKVRRPGGYIWVTYMGNNMGTYTMCVCTLFLRGICRPNNLDNALFITKTIIN